MKILRWLCVPTLCVMCCNCMASNSTDPFDRITDPDPAVRVEAVAELGELDDPRVLPALKHVLFDPEWNVQWAAAKILGSTRNPAILDELITGLDSDDLQQRQGCVLALAHSPKKRALDALIAQCTKRNFAFRWQVGEAIGRAENRAFIPMLLVAMRKNSDWRVQEVSAVALGEMHEVVGIKPLLQSLRSKNEYVRMIACWQLGRIGDPSAVDVLISVILRKYDTYEHRVWGTIAMNMIGKQLNPVFVVNISGLARANPKELNAFAKSWAKIKHRYINNESP